MTHPPLVYRGSKASFQDRVLILDRPVAVMSPDRLLRCILFEALVNLHLVRLQYDLSIRYTRYRLHLNPFVPIVWACKDYGGDCNRCIGLRGHIVGSKMQVDD